MKSYLNIFLVLIVGNVQAKQNYSLSWRRDRAEKFVREAIDKNDVVAFTKSYCPYSHRARKALASAGIEFKHYDIDKMPDMRMIQDELERITGARTVPRVFIHQKFYGGGTDTAAGVASGEVLALVQAGKQE